MFRINRFVFTVIQFVLLVDNTKQSKITQGINTLKAIGNTMKGSCIRTIGNNIKKPIIKNIGNTIKNSMGMFSQKTNNIKNVALGIEKGGERYLRSRNNVVTKSVKYLGEGALHKYKVPQGVRGGNKLLRTGIKKNTQMRSAKQMGEKGLKSLINMVSKSKPQLPFLFAAGGFTKLRGFNLVPENDGFKEIPVTNKPSQKTNMKFFDIHANMADDMFKGIYNDKQFHQADFHQIIKRANDYGVDKFLFVGRYLQETLNSVKLLEGRSDCWTTVGVYPSRTSDIEKDGGIKEDYYEKMENAVISLGKKVLAIGECGLDYDRQQWSDRETQLKHFPMHFDMAEKFNLPMYLHSRNSGVDFLRIVKENRHRFSDGVVHSFTGDEEELNGILDLGLYVGINGCSLKTNENIEITKKIPLDRIMFKTDCPYCEIRNSYASMKYVTTKIPRVNNKKKWNPEKMIKNRNEPCKIMQICEVVSAIKGVSEEELANVAYENACKVFLKEN